MSKRRFVPMLCCFAGLLVSRDVMAETAQDILDATGVKGGLVVHLGCGDGKLTATLRVSDSYVIHGLDTETENVAAAREYIHSLGIYGSVSLDSFDGRHLPYADNLVNLLVAQDLDSVSMAEVKRVLCPNGVAYIKKGDHWSKTVKPWPDNIDEWSHFMHDAGNNAVAKDTVVGPPRQLQWVASPLWLRSHETPSGFQAQVSAGGRLFYILDEGLIGITDPRLPDRWSIVCRDAFNGKLLWKRPIEPWGWREWATSKWEGQDWTVVRAGRVAVPEENQRRLVAQGDRLYATLGFLAPLSILDAATGDLIKTVEGTDGTKAIFASDGVVLAYINESLSDSAKRSGKKTKSNPFIVAVDGETGETLWRREAAGIRPSLTVIHQGRVIFQAAKELACFGLKNGQELWRIEPEHRGGMKLVSNNGVVFILGKGSLEAHRASDGKLLWNKKISRGSGDKGGLYVAGGLLWTGIYSVDEKYQPAKKTSHAMAVGLDPLTGEEKKRIFARNLRSYEHHHRCYPNKATDRYLISSMEGPEFMDLRSDNHSQNNWLRGACKLGMMPCNGMLYSPPDQCFCHPGSKLLGLTAIGPEPVSRQKDLPDAARLVKGPAYGKNPKRTRNPQSEAWPTFRHDPARSGATHSAVSTPVAAAWSTKLGGKLTPPVAANGKIFVAASDAHTVYALDIKTGAQLWKFTAGGRIDSPPTIFDGLAIFGSKDGRVYCLRESDGSLVWRFMAAPSDRRIGYFGQVESTWPVHGSVLISDGVAYVGAGRSTYLDGGIRLYGLDPATGKILYKGLLEGPHPDGEDQRDYSFYTTGANSDVLVAEAGFLYMRQKKLTLALKEIEVDDLSVKGEKDVGLHVFSTSGLLDGSWYNRTFWMYSKRWPGFQLANQAPKTGQLLVVGDENTYAVKVFYRRNTHSPMFFPGKEGFLVFADNNSNEPQIVGEEGARKPLRWLPQSDYSRGNEKGIRKLDSPAFGEDKMVGYTRAELPVWTQWVKIRVRAMVKAADVLFVAGPPDVLDQEDPYAAFEGRRGGRLAAISTLDGEKLLEIEFDSPPVFDGMIAASGRLFVSLKNGSVMCLQERHSQ